ncbi:S9 family peptidase [secondary endosymbiont of Ctenarytaina eucalypti]|uniref:Protease II n=1 Tax=secondary endosymbiont of Ctenarytaina eucalypti TaxID=1199245 RepID=J3Z2Z5_9ENTR|nr:prolyl oligopeptidase family serine peptidase [secondary endosymbiont of Ctenarytaina eucalypti]AFP84589.1 protease II [secondary endosymbiont of Ctenarytaina eucalypti]
MTLPPKAEKRLVTLTVHGDARTDNYYWLRDDQRQDQEVLSYLQKENAYGTMMMAKNETLRKQLFTEMVERIPQQDHSAYYVWRNYRYQSRYEEGNEHAIYMRQPASANPKESWEVLLDGNQRATKGEFYTMSRLDISPDNRIMAVAEDFLSRCLYELRFKDVVRDAWFPEVIEYTSSSFEWANDSRVLYYVHKHPKTLLPYQVWRHIVGTTNTEDELIYEEKDDTFYVNVHKTTSQRYILIVLSSATSGETLLIDADDPKSKPKRFLLRRRDHEYSLDHYQGCFYIRSNREGKNFALYRGQSGEESMWQVLVPALKEVVLESFLLFHKWLVIEERHLGLTTLRQISWLTGEEKNITFDDPAYMTWLAYNPDPKSVKMRYGYSSMTKPTTLFEINLDTGERKLLKQQKIKNFQEELYSNERLWVASRDGVQVPVSLVYRKDLFKPGSNPLLVYGYGSYGSSMDPDFSSSRLSLLDRGFVFALIHIRGGGELGPAWHEDGKLLNKMNTFNDFIDSSRELLRQGYGAPDKVFAMGGSAGGLLMGAVINLAPDLFKGVVAQVPFVDVITTMLDESIPLTTSEYEEWGNPKDEISYRYMLQYSPYDQVRAQNYPHLLVTTGLHDSQVQYWEPAKWVAKLREFKTDDHMLLLYTDMHSGHGGKSGRFKGYEEVSLIYAFILALVQGSTSPFPTGGRDNQAAA